MATGKDPTTEMLLNLYEVHAQEAAAENNMRAAQQKLESARMKKTMLGRTAIPTVLAQVQENREKAAAKAAKTQKLEEQNRAAPGVAPPLTEVTGTTTGRGGAGGFSAAADIASAVLGGRATKTSPAGQPPGAGGGTAQPPIIQSRTGVAGGAPAGGTGQVAAGAPGSLVPITNKLSGPELLVSGLGALGSIATKSPGGIVQYGRELATGKEILGYQRLPTTDELATDLATEMRRARETGDLGGLQARTNEIRGQYPAYWDDINKRATVIDKQLEIDARRTRGQWLMEVQPKLANAGVFDADPVLAQQYKEAILDNRTDDAARIVSEFRPKVSEAQERELSAAAHRLNMKAARLDIDLKTAAYNALTAVDPKNDRWTQRFGTPSPYKAAATLTGLGLPSVLTGGQGGSNKGLMTAAEVAQSKAAAVTWADDKFQVDPGGAVRARDAMLQDYFVRPDGPIQIISTGEKKWGLDQNPGVVQVTNDAEFTTRFQLAQGAGLDTAASTYISQDPNLPENLSQYQGRTITPEMIASDNNLRQYVTGIQRKNAEWFKNFGFPVDVHDRPSGGLDVVIGHLDPLSDDAQVRENTHLNLILDSEQILYERMLAGGLRPTDLPAIPEAPLQPKEDLGLPPELANDPLAVAGATAWKWVGPAVQAKIEQKKESFGSTFKTLQEAAQANADRVMKANPKNMSMGELQMIQSSLFTQLSKDPLNQELTDRFNAVQHELLGRR